MNKKEKETVLVMPDFSAEAGIWIDSRCLMYPVEYLGITKSLDRKLRKWIEDYDETVFGEKPFPYAAHTDRGRRLAQELKNQLGDEYEVLYWNEEKNIHKELGERAVFETIEEEFSPKATRVKKRGKMEKS